MNDASEHFERQQNIRLLSDMAAGMSRHTSRLLIGTGSALALTFSQIGYFESKPLHPYPVTAFLLIFGWAFMKGYYDDAQVGHLIRSTSRHQDSPEKASDEEVAKLLLKMESRRKLLRGPTLWFLFGLLTAILFVPLAAIVEERADTNHTQSETLS